MMVQHQAPGAGRGKEVYLADLSWRERGDPTRDKEEEAKRNAVRCAPPAARSCAPPREQSGGMRPASPAQS
jgi:hypothetical protein